MYYCKLACKLQFLKLLALNLPNLLNNFNFINMLIKIAPTVARNLKNVGFA